MTNDAALPSPAQVAKAPASRRKVVAALVAALGLGAATTYYLHSRHFEDTDDAQIDGEIATISPRVPGTIAAALVTDHQPVQAGDPLIEIDPTDFQVAVAQAKAGLAQAEAAFQAENPSISMTETTNQTGLASAEADLASAESGLIASDREVKQLTAQLDLARANAKNAATEKDRAQRLFESGSVSQAEVDNRTTAADASGANVAAMTAALAGAQARYAQGESRITSARSRVSELRTNAPRQVDVRKANVGVREAALTLARAQLRQAELNLSYTKIAAPAAGVVGKKSVSVGDRVAPGQQLMAVARIDDLWVTANFRETQIRDMHPGQPATVHVDALGLDLRGAVLSIGGATGSRFSLFPPENASGNYVKVVQRIPVRIKLDPGQPGMDRLRTGMSVEPEVRVR
jgi:membrane fusion protein (multidrug efflux system)